MTRRPALLCAQPPCTQQFRQRTPRFRKNKPWNQSTYTFKIKNWHRIIEIILWCLMLGSMITPIRGEGHMIEEFEHSPGIHFESIGRMYLSNHVWTIAATTDVTPWLGRAEQVLAHHVYAQYLYQKAPEYSKNFKLVLEQRMDSFYIEKKLIQDLLGVTEPKRGRRGLINGLGTVAKSLFGTMDAEDAQQINDRLSKLEGGQGTAYDAAKKQIEIVNSTIFELEKTEEIIQKNEEILLKTTKELSKRMEERFNSSITRDDMDEHFMVLNAILDGVVRDGEKIKNLLTNDKGKIFEYGVFTQLSLINILKKAILPKGLSFPVQLDVGDMHQLEKLSTVSTHHFGKKIVTLIEIPLVNFQIFDVYKVHSVPTKTTEKFHSFLSAENELLVIHRATQQFIPLSIQQLEKCGRLQDQYLCTEILPTHTIKPYSPCEVQMYFNPKEIPGTCTVKHVVISRFTLIHMWTKNAWIYVTPQPEEVTIKCNDLENRTTLQNSGILHVENHCEVVTADFTIRGRKSSEMKMDLHILPRLNLTLNESTSLSLRDAESKIQNTQIKSVVRNLNELKDLQLQLKVEENQLDKAAEFNIREFIQQPSTIYSSVVAVIVLSAVITLYCWCRTPWPGARAAAGTRDPV